MSKRSRRDRRSNAPRAAAASPASLEVVAPPPQADEAAEHDELASGFFDQGKIETSAPPDFEVADAPARQSFSPAAVERRARYARYVKVLVAACTAVCVVAVLRSATAQASRTASLAVSSPAALETKIHISPPPVVAPEPVPEPPAPDVAITPPVASALPTPIAPSTDPVAARHELHIAQVALEARRLADAIAAGGRATTLDPTDGEAWLVLGASYQEAGQLDDARRCYRACLSEGRRGPKAECAAMLR